MIKRMIIALMLVLLPISGYASVTEGETVRQYFTCNGNTTTFTFTFKCNSSDDVLVWKHLISTGVETALVEDTDYTIAPTGNYLNGGTVTISPALAGTYRVVIVRSIKKSQETSSGAMTPISVVAALDKITRQIQDLEDRNDRSIHLQESDAASFDMEIPGLALRAETFPYFNDSGELTYVASVISGSTIVSSYMETLLDDADAGAAKITLDLGWVDVTSYDAKGDGETDDSTAIQTAIDVVEDAGGGIVFFPPGIYKANNLAFTNTDATAKKPEEIHLVGYGAEIKNVHASNPTFKCSVSYKRGLYFEGLHLNGDDNSTLAFDLTGAIRVRFNRISIRNHKAGGIYLSGCYYGYMEDVLIKKGDSTPDAGAKGANIEGGGGNFKIISCEFDGWPIGCRVYHLFNGGGVIFSAFENNDIGLDIAFAKGTIIQGNYFANNTDDDILMGSSGVNPRCIGVVISGNYFVDSVTNATNAINLDEVWAAVIQANYCHSRTNFVNATANTKLQTKNLSNNYIDTANRLAGSGIAIPSLTNDATPSVDGYDVWLTGGTTTITDLDDGYSGQTITIIAEHSLDITDGTNIFLSGSTTWSMTATDTLTLICKADNKWYEVSRSDSGA